MEGKTLRELNVQPGDVVRLFDPTAVYTVRYDPHEIKGQVQIINSSGQESFLFDDHVAVIVSRAGLLPHGFAYLFDGTVCDLTITLLPSGEPDCDVPVKLEKLK